uniref:Lysosomal dipeptide transporter MFSD1 n=2 Tax=Mucochytrium quahogii TaxID=96639 RepID=A0A7S2S2U8_9STRA
MIKWLVLGLGSFELFAAYYSVDNPAALHDQLKEYFETSTQMDFEIFFNAMYTVYSVPNVVLPFLGGYLIDRYGPARMNTVFCSVLLVGQVITAIGVLVKYEYLALVGRTVFGVGAESLCVGVSVLLASWFLGSNVAFAMGLSLSISRVGSVVNNVLSGIVASSLALSFAFFSQCNFSHGWSSVCYFRSSVGA